MGVPTMYVGLLEAAKTSDLRPQLKSALSGGAALPVPVLEKFAEVFGTNVLEGYGLTETSPVATFNQKGFEPKPGTVGKTIWGVEVEVAKAERRRPHRAAADRRARRDRGPRPQHLQGLPQQARGHGRGDRRRLVPHR